MLIFDTILLAAEVKRRNMTIRNDNVKIAYPLFRAGDDSTPASAIKARDLIFDRCPVDHAIECVREWHSRLPRCQKGPWQFAFSATYQGITYAVALWNNPSTRSLPSHWLELRRMACSPDVPKNTCSRFLGWMVRYFKKEHSYREMCISYQDTAVHTGTIYKAAGWYDAYHSQFRIRDRSKNRRGTERAYRTNKNGMQPDASPKVRWQCKLT